MRSLASTSGGHWGSDLDRSAGELMVAVGDLWASVAVAVVPGREEERGEVILEGVGLRLIFGLEIEFASVV